MSTCIKCGKVTHHDGSNRSTMCLECAGEEVDKMSNKLAMAKVGLAALIDEATGYQDVRPPKDLAKFADLPSSGIWADKTESDDELLEELGSGWRGYGKIEEEK